MVLPLLVPVTPGHRHLDELPTAHRALGHRNGKRAVPLRVEHAAQTTRRRERQTRSHDHDWEDSSNAIQKLKRVSSARRGYQDSSAVGTSHGQPRLPTMLGFWLGGLGKGRKIIQGDWRLGASGDVTGV